MRIFTFFDAHLRGDSPRLQTATMPGIGHCLCVIPATAGVGHRCDYVRGSSPFVALTKTISGVMLGRAWV